MKAGFEGKTSGGSAIDWKVETGCDKKEAKAESRLFLSGRPLPKLNLDLDLKNPLTGSSLKIKIK